MTSSLRFSLCSVSSRTNPSAVERSGFADSSSIFSKPEFTPTFTWNFGDENTNTTTLTPSHIYADDGVYNVSLTVDDQHGGVVSDTLVVTITNVAPTVVAGADQHLNIGSTATINATFSDPGSDDTHTATINWGDENETAGIVDQGTVTASHTYTQTGEYTVTITVNDDDGGQGSDTLTISVKFNIFLPLIVREE